MPGSCVRPVLRFSYLVWTYPPPFFENISPEIAVVSCLDSGGGERRVSLCLLHGCCEGKKTGSACRDVAGRMSRLHVATPFPAVCLMEPPPTSNPCTDGRFVQSPGQKEQPNPNKKGPADERLASLQSKKPATSRVNATRELHLPLPPTRTMQIKVLFEYKKRHRLTGGGN